MSKQPYDVLVIGSGSAGFSAIESATSLGARVCVIEKRRLGGECPNDACIPMKAILRAAKCYRMAQHTKVFGVHVGALSYQFSEVVAYRKKVVETMTGGGEHGERYERILKSLKADVRYGEARFVNDHTVLVNGEAISAKTIIIATGTTDRIPPIKGLDQIHYVRWKEAIAQTRQPKSIAIIGGGPVGCEIATFYATFGTRVVLIQRAPRVLHQEDEEFSHLALEILQEQGVEVLTQATVSEIVDGRGGVYGVRVDDGHAVHMHAVEQVILATGKCVHVEGLGLDQTNVRFNERGFIVTNKHQETSVPHIFCAGDVDGGFLFTHTAHQEGAIAGYHAARMALKKRVLKKTIDQRVVPHVLFLAHEFASVGLTEAEAKKRYKKILVGRYDVANLGRAVTEQERYGRIKLIAHPKTRKLLGAHMIGDRAGEVIHEAALAIQLNATVDKLAALTHAFPTYSEALKAAASRM